MSILRRDGNAAAATVARRSELSFATRWIWRRPGNVAPWPGTRWTRCDGSHPRWPRRWIGALRPAEAVSLRTADCGLPSVGWGRLYLSHTAPEVG